VHVRSVQDPGNATLRSRWVAGILRRHADAVIAIDETVRRSLPPGIAAEVIHNAYSPRSASDASGSAGSPLPPRRAGILRVAMVGNLLPVKGVHEFLSAARVCRSRNLPVEFVIVGGNTRALSGMAGWLVKATGFAHDMEGEVKRFVAEHGLEDNVHLIAFTPDIDSIYGNIDVLCFPSLLDAPGRPVFEAAHWKVPSIVAMETPLPDTIVHRETGLCVKPGDAPALADAIEHFSRNPAELQRMGKAAHRLARRNFDARKNAARVLQIYRRLRDRAARRQQPA
jgi:glycosyltransferase involved in cell wall biosynthesis